MAIPILEGAWIGHSFYTFKRTEESYRAGVNRFGTATTQMACVNNALHQVGAAMEGAGIQGDD